MINIYCDESCHLENDNSDIMVLGSIQVNETLKSSYFNEIRKIKAKHNMSTWNEVKWTKVSNSKIEFYFELVDWFFANEIYFRGLIAQNKKELDHSRYSEGDYDLWYYKMYFRLIDPLLEWGNEYKIFIDIKDTRGGNRVKKLYEVLCNNMYDFNGSVLKDVQQIQSHQSEILQVCDLIIGALSYYHRGLYNENKPTAKNKLINYLKTKYEINLDYSSYRSEKKFNLFVWTPEGVR
ncbi:DUF3800 domain-containing protein [Sporosarcina luteola]|uniref:DUF3800 domain-containing protein n=1 Tax=Sporosarcina luteola TaxID=582850 RepID=UPI00203C1570|nr:DUF3800 domain-containing protein [Sporosarcina luteola]MCM3711052.1 DUF3800 domain-containing protein [Sporosarcina luteola]